MTRYAGNIGFYSGETNNDGIVTPSYTDHKMRGDTFTVRALRTESQQRQDDLSFSNQLSLLGDQYSFENFSNIVYAEFMGQKWKVTSVEIQYPRMTLTLGGIWNGDN